MNDFLVLEAELSRLERSDFKPVPTSAVLPPSDLSSIPSTSTPSTEEQNRVASLIRALNPTVLPALPVPTLSLPNGDSTHSPSTPASSQSLPSRPLGSTRDPAEPVESLWWDLVASTSVSSQLFPQTRSTPRPTSNGTRGHSTDHHPRPSSSATEELPIAALSAGVPRIPWVGYSATPYTTTSTGVDSKANGKGKGKAVENGTEPKVKKARKVRKEKKQSEIGLGSKMRQNCDQLRRIRKEGDRLMRESQTGDLTVSFTR